MNGGSYRAPDVEPLKGLRSGLRTVKNAAIDRTGRIIARHGATERRLVSMARRRPVSRPLQWLCESVGRAAAGSPNRFRVVAIGDGLRLVVDISDFLRSVYFYGLEYEPEVSAVLRRVLRAGDTAIDVGANAGYHCLRMAALVGPAGSVHAFEPAPDAAALLRRSVELNGFAGRVRVEQAAVSDRRAADVAFHLSALGHNSGVASLVAHEWGTEHGFFSPSRTTRVSTVTLDDYCAAAGLTACRVIKIDVEGTEQQVVQGMRGMLARGEPSFILCEARIGGGADRALRDCGFHAWALGAAGPMPASPGWWGNVLYASPAALQEAAVAAGMR
jgi:FkbM family methyltransferase